MGQNKNSAKIYTASSQGKLNVSFNDTKQIINVTNNKAKSYEEFAAKYRDEAKKYRDEAQEFAEQNSNVTMEDIYQVQNLLESKINTKQPVGDYALVSQIPENVSDLNNDSQYATVTQLANLLPSQSASDGKFLKTDGEGLEWANISAFSLFDTKLSDHILEGEEGFGWALQGTYTLSSYTDFYQKCLAEKTAGVATQTTLGESTITTYNNANGHIFYDIADKAVVDAYYNQTGVAWFYGIDTANERIFLPRNDWFEQCSSSNPGKFVNAGLPNHKHYEFVSTSRGTSADSQTEQQLYNNMQVSSLWYGGYASYSMARNLETADVGLSSNPVGGIYGNSSTVQPSSVKKLLYICVGNTMVNEADVDVANLTTDVQNLETNKADKTEVDGKFAQGLLHQPLLANATLPAKSTTTYDLSSALPVDNEEYLVCLNFNGRSSAATGAINLSGKYQTAIILVLPANIELASGGWVVVGSDRKIKITAPYASQPIVGVYINITSYRRIGKNQ